MTKCPGIVLSYGQYYDSNPFQPTSLNCAIPSDNSDLDNNLIPVVTYNRHCTLSDGNCATLISGIQRAISVNAIVGHPTFKKWKLLLDVSEQHV